MFFFKQKTAYEMLRSLVGSEMCIRDRLKAAGVRVTGIQLTAGEAENRTGIATYNVSKSIAVSYTHLTLPTIYSV